MPTAKTKSEARSQNGSGITSLVGEVLDLTEAAAYLRCTEADLLHMIGQQNLPGRLIGEQWRFLKSALQDWLGKPPPRPSKEAVLARIGSWENDPFLDQELEEIHKRRGRQTGADGK
jgi:excisionase family DNA binding protein